MAKSTVGLLDLSNELLAAIVQHVREDDEYTCNPLGSPLGIFGISAQTHPNLRSLALTCRLLSLHASEAFISHSLGLRGGRDGVSHEKRLQNLAEDESLRTKVRHMAFCIDAYRLMAAGRGQPKQSLDAFHEKWRSTISKFSNLRSVSLDLTLHAFIRLPNNLSIATRLQQIRSFFEGLHRSLYAGLSSHTSLKSVAWLQPDGVPPILKEPQFRDLAGRLKSLSIGIVYPQSSPRTIYYEESTGTYSDRPPVVNLGLCLRYCRQLQELRVCGLKDFNARKLRPRIKLSTGSPQTTMMPLVSLNIQYLCVDGLADLLALTKGTISSVHLYMVRPITENTWLPTLQTLLECEKLQSTVLSSISHQPDVGRQIAPSTTDQRHRYWQASHPPDLFFEELVALGKVLAMMRRRRGDLTSDFDCSSLIKPFNDLATGSPVQGFAPGKKLGIVPFDGRLLEYLASPARKWTFPRDPCELKKLFVPHHGIHPGCIFEVFGLSADDARTNDFLLKLSFAAHYSKSSKTLRAPPIYQNKQQKQTFIEFSALVLEAVRDFQSGK